MEFVSTRRGKKRKRSCIIIANQRRDSFGVRSRKSKKSLRVEQNSHPKKTKLTNNTMEASAFWENYKAGHEWQKRHDVMWWKTRCFALEHENHVLRETIRNFSQNKNNDENLINVDHNEQQHHTVVNDNEEEDNNEDNIEFQLNEDMMNFLAQSIRHKIELKNLRESEEAAEQSDECDNGTLGGIGQAHKRSESAKLLYGNASSKILAMETALQTTIERHIDKSKPQYWPNIPLKL